MTTTPDILRFRRLGILTICAVYCVILAGGIVRASGSGMGCPDWPTCFGQLIPPTDVSQLPTNYRELYLGGEFNVVKTWTEYANRLIGVIIGVLIIATAWSSRIFRHTDKTIFYLAIGSVFLVGFQGWLGSAVVASELKPLIITLHMVLALFIVALLIYTVTRSHNYFLGQFDYDLPDRFNTVLLVAMGMTLLQVAMGTQVRETVDYLVNAHHIARQFLRDDFPIIFYIHRSFSSVILFTNLWLVWKTYRSDAPKDGLFFRAGVLLVGLIITAILAGVSLDRLSMPAVAQPIHLLMANLIFGVQFFLYNCRSYAVKKSFY